MQHASSVIAGAGGPLGALAYTLLAGPLSEEFGWRGYVQPRLRRHYGRIAVTVPVGAAWGLWHVPLFHSRSPRGAPALIRAVE
jgi:membrane protease YdiL (CAAX protease family)